ncbi:Dihydropteroate synthase, DHPS [Oceaniovalibus guishaninsula JLT2003]|uniref:Dihydropteroate synthase n=1 Tax=Oceaniovalibus guishaninsula JLT2003 TaxID=1231392 RepID=K2I6X6_9RHOB|nr:dihydropteroate synthase [Oceaniovalibus guishaninsula]EKE44755.1 Dihydropteroate synthase, DHPS [Oceaniovalibus guishaninsula JLT2003]
MTRFRPLAQGGRARPAGALTLAGGWTWFTHAEVLERGAPPRIVPAADLPAAARDRLTAPRAPLAGLALDRPRIMAILNVTPDSFSDGGLHAAPDSARAQAEALIAAGADILDIGGESTRPGAQTLPDGDEAARIVPAVQAARAVWSGPISMDTRKAGVARAAVAAGASFVNDVAALTFDPGMAAFVAETALPVCLMHAQGTPETMQRDPHYDDVVLDVLDWLEARIDAAVAAGIPRDRIAVDPGIGFGKTLDHNLALLAKLSVFHDLGCAVLLGASRKRFIGTLTDTDRPNRRMPGSLAVALAAVAQGVQIVRVHDMAETRAALTVWRAATTGERE